MSETLATLPPGMSGLAPVLADKKRGSAAGSVPWTSDVATGESVQRHVSPLGANLARNINDDAGPPGTRRVVSREPPAPPPGVILQAVGDSGACERALSF